MSNPHEYNDDQTRQFRPTQPGYTEPGYGQSSGYGQQPGYAQSPQGYQGNPGHPGQRNPQHVQGDQNWGGKEKSGLIAGRFEAQKVIVNLVVLGVLSAAVTFAAVFVVDLLLSQFAGTSAGGVGTAVVIGLIAGIVGVLSGLLYIPVVGTGNEHLFGLAVIALAVVAAIVWVLLGGLLDGDWRTLITLTGIVATAMTAYASRPRIEAADVRYQR
ncbi:hypothetical protein ACUY3M_00045 [Corynebacterium suicordis]